MREIFTDCQPSQDILQELQIRLINEPRRWEILHMLPVLLGQSIRHPVISHIIHGFRLIIVQPADCSSSVVGKVVLSSVVLLLQKNRDKVTVC